MSYFDGQSATLEQAIGHLSPVEQIRMLMHHPYFTGRCPECRQPIHYTSVTIGQCHCSHCGWNAEPLTVTADFPNAEEQS